MGSILYENDNAYNFVRLYFSTMSETIDERVKVYPGRGVDWKAEKTNWYLLCQRCRDFWVLEIHELKNGNKDILVITGGCSHLKWVKKVKNPKIIIAEVITKAGTIYLIPRKPHG